MKFNPVLFAKAISDETRQKIMNLCCCCSLSVNEIVEKLDVSQPTVSHHLAILREERVAFCCGQLMVKFAPETATTEAFKKTVEA
jgi:ArsR family transcriptional regulator, arsenate/arsenite/antimonite-responsive transcriptional repressor